MNESSERNSPSPQKGDVTPSTPLGKPTLAERIQKAKPGEWIVIESEEEFQKLPVWGMRMDNEQPSGKKLDQDKSRVDLLDPEFLMDVGMVMGFGAKKYAAHNWRGGISISRLIGAAIRHLLAICRGEDIDSESGLPHTAHLGCCVMFLHWTLKHKPELDDRFKY